MGTETDSTDFDFDGYLRRITRVLQYFGVWQVRGRSSRLAKVCYMFYTVFVLLLYNFTNFAMVRNLFDIHDNMELFLSSLLLTFMDCYTNMKAFFVMKNQGRILRLAPMLKKPSFQPKNRRQLENVKAIFRDFDICYIVFSLFPTLTIASWAIFPLVENRDQRRLPIMAKYSYDYKKSPLYEITFVHQIVSFMYIAHIQLNFDCLLYALMATGVAQLELLSDSVKHIYEESEEETNHSSVEAFEHELDRKLKLCIDHHKDILLFFDQVYVILNINILAQFAISTGSLCLTIFNVSSTRDPLSTEFAAVVLYAMSLSFQLLFYCWWGNEVMLKSQEVPTAAFESNWCDAPLSYQKKLVFFIHRTQKPIVMLAVDFFRLTIETFTGILRTSYSCYAVLHHMRTREISDS